MKTILNKLNNCKICETIIGYNKFSLKSHGNILSEIILVSEAPSAKSLNRNKFWLGAGGKLLRNCLPKEFTLESLFYLTDIVKCWPNKNNRDRKPYKNEINNCSSYLKSEIETLKPKFIISFGNTSSSYLLNRKVYVTKEHGNIYKYNEYTKVLVLIHPSRIDLFLKREIFSKQLNELFIKIINKDFDAIEFIFKKKYEFNVSKTYSNNISKSELTDQKIFTIPSVENLITVRDIENKQIRITSEFKKYFPTTSTEIEIVYNNKIFVTNFLYKGQRSHIIKISYELIQEFPFKPFMNIKFTKINENKYKIEKCIGTNNN